MVLDEGVWTGDGRLVILKKGAVLTLTWIERLKNFAKAQGLKERVCVGRPQTRRVYPAPHVTPLKSELYSAV
jgi:hypothetical protein